jgi:hypothetical protein
LNRKPDRALAMLQKTRAADLSNDLRDQRLLIEARAMSNLGRHEVALELITNINSREAMRLRSDILLAFGRALKHQSSRRCGNHSESAGM